MTLSKKSHEATEGGYVTGSRHRAPPSDAPARGDGNPLVGRGGASGKAKKEFLQWKRQQRRERANQTDSEGEEEARSQHAPLQPGLAAAGPAQGARPGQRGQEPEALGRGAVKGGGVPAGGMGTAQARPHQRGGRPSDSSAAQAPIRPEPLEPVPPSGRLMPRLVPSEAGFTPEAASLDMPRRPAWEGVSDAEALHRMEEESFHAWQRFLIDQYGGGGAADGRLSFYETRLDFWRQLWRVLERSDIAIMIVDARNPLLHFSLPLYRDCVDKTGKPLILLMNKADLCPPEVIDMWRRWFGEHFPGLRAVVASAAQGPQGEASVLPLMEEVLGCPVVRGGGEVRVSDIVGLGAAEVMLQSKLRNLHSHKARDLLALQQGAIRGTPLPALQHTSTDGDHASAEPSTAGPSGEDTERRGAYAGGQPSGPSSAAAALAALNGSDADWDKRGTKAKKKAVVRDKRRHRGQGGEEGSEGDEAVGRGGRAGTSKAEPKGRSSKPNQQGKSRARLPCSDDEEEGGGDGGPGSARGGPSRRRGQRRDLDSEGVEQDSADVTDSEGGPSEASGAEEEDSDNDNEAFEALERAPGARGSTRGAAAAGSAQASSDDRPVVVCVVGEPNVGKSSTMNALLGAHRVAVSSHPGRTKHYQTHIMVPKRLMLCDCPGLVFPKLDVTLPIQVIFGCYPIARVREPYSVVRYLMERHHPPLWEVLGLGAAPRDPEEEGTTGRGKGGAAAGSVWSPLSLCEAMAEKHGWKSKRGGRLDVYRAANFILRAALAGRQGVVLGFLPPAEAPAADEAQRQASP